MNVACLMPTYNRPHLVCESLECFLRQDDERCHLYICNDRLGQELVYDHPRVTIWNIADRFKSLSDKLCWMINQTTEPLLMRWDDDDIMLPWRVSLSIDKIGEGDEWRCDNYWYNPKDQMLPDSQHGNVHVSQIWHRRIHDKIGGYPNDVPSGCEDQAFLERIRKAGYPYRGEILPLDKMFYIYRWGVGVHLSGEGGGEAMDRKWLKRGYEQSVGTGKIRLHPHWYADYVALATQSVDGALKSAVSP